MNEIKVTLLMAGILDFAISIFLYFLLRETWLVYFAITPTILIIVLFLPILRTLNQINNAIKKQNGICYHCKLKIDDPNEATLEDDNYIYCKSCTDRLFGHLYEERDGIWYKKDKSEEM